MSATIEVVGEQRPIFIDWAQRAMGSVRLAPDAKTIAAVKDGDWNEYRIVAKGARIQTWINGEAVEDLTDEAKFQSHPKGFIALQVHGIGAGQGPYSVQWRNIKIKELK